MANPMVVVMLARQLGKSYAASIHRAMTKTPTSVLRAPVTTPRDVAQSVNVDTATASDTTVRARHWVDREGNGWWVDEAAEIPEAAWEKLTK